MGMGWKRAYGEDGMEKLSSCKPCSCGKGKVLVYSWEEESDFSLENRVEFRTEIQCDNCKK